MRAKHIDAAIDNYCVDQFAQRMKEKLGEARAKGKGGWWDVSACSPERLSGMLLEHVRKGDPIDVANIAMFLWCRGVQMGSETQETVSAWAEETFGPVSSNARVAARANEEMAELLRVLTSDDNHTDAGEEMADVVIILYRLADRMGYDLVAEVNQKMAINRGRQWSRDGSGHGYHHVEGDAEYCHASRDGDCAWGGCPQVRDGESRATGRSCPLWTEEKNAEY